MALSPHRNNTHQQPSKWQQKCGHGPQMVRMKPRVGTEPRTGTRPWDVGMEPHAAHTRRWKWNVSPKGGIGVLGYIRPTTFSISAPIQHELVTQMGAFHCELATTIFPS